MPFLACYLYVIILENNLFPLKFSIYLLIMFNYSILVLPIAEWAQKYILFWICDFLEWMVCLVYSLASPPWALKLHSSWAFHVMVFLIITYLVVLSFKITKILFDIFLK